MPDYDLGRAHGEINITADTRGAQEAQAAMASTAAEAAVLDRSMTRVNQRFDENRRTQVASAEAITRHRQQVEDLRNAYERYNNDYVRATDKKREAEDKLAQALKNEHEDVQRLHKLSKDVEKARDNEQQLLLRMEAAYAKYQVRMAGVRLEVAKFNEEHIKASSAFNQLRVRADELGESLEKVSGHMASLLRTVGQGGIMGLLGLGSAGSTTAFGAAGLSGITNVIFGMMEAVQQLSGVLALLPAIAQGAGVALGTLAVGFQGVGKALSSMGDPRQFIESLKELSPAARQAMQILYTFQDAFRGARQAVQNSLFAPIIADIQPLIQQWLPELMRAGQAVGNQFGQMAHVVAQFFESSGAQQSFQTFTQNMVKGMEAARGAIQPLLSAWQTLSEVGSGFFQRIGGAITQVANEFNQWVSGAAQSGKLQAWISSALTGFTELGHIVLNLFESLGNIMAIGDKYGGGFLQFVQEITQEFKAWTESADGMAKINNFFQLLHEAGRAVHPILKLVGEGIATVAGAFTRLGIQIAPAVTEFFKDVVSSLHILAPILQQIGPSIGTFIKELGVVLLDLVQQLGPQLPGLFQGLSEALVKLVGILPTVVPLLAKFLSLLNDKDIQIFIGAAVAVRGLAVAVGILTAILDLNPIVLFAGAIAAMVVGIIYAYDHVKGFHDAVNDLLGTLGNLGNTILGTVRDAWHSVENWFNSLDWSNIGKSLVQQLIDGMLSMITPVGGAAHSIVNVIKEFWQQGSPAKRGPLSEVPTGEMGSRLSEQYAEGISSGTGAVATAGAGVAAGAASGLGGAPVGTTGIGFTSAGSGGVSGGGVQGKSGFDQYINFLTTDLRAWNQIFRDSFSLVQTAISGVSQGIRLVADLWGGGNNPLTQPGGILGPQQLWGQQHVPGVPDIPAPGQAPDQWARGLGAPGQQPVGGVPSVSPRGKPYGPGINEQQPASTPAPQAPGAGPAAATGGKSAGAAAATGVGAHTAGAVAGGVGSGSQQDIANYIISSAIAHGFSRDEANAFVAQAYGESNLGTNTYGATTGDQSGAARGIFQFTPGTATSIGLANPDDPKQNIDAYFRLFAQRDPGGGDIRHRLAKTSRGGPAVPGNIGLTWQQAQAGAAPFVQNATVAPPVATTSTDTSLPPVFGQNRPGVVKNEGGQLMPAASNIANIIQTLFPEIQTIGGVHPNQLSYHPSGHALDIMLPGDYSSDASIALGTRINNFLRENAEALGIGDTIFRDRYFPTGGPDVPYNAAANTPDERHLTHVHITTQGPGGIGGPKEPMNFERNIRNLKLPPGVTIPGAPPPATTVGDVNAPTGFPYRSIHRLGEQPTLDDRIGGYWNNAPSWAKVTGGVGAGVLGGLGIYGASSYGKSALGRFGLAYQRATFNQYDALARRDVLRGMSPEEAAGIDPADIQFGRPTGGISGLLADISGGGTGATPFDPLADWSLLGDMSSQPGAGGGGVSGRPSPGIGRPTPPPQRLFRVTPEGVASQVPGGPRVGPPQRLFSVGGNGVVTEVPGGPISPRGIFGGSPELGPLQGPLPPPGAPYTPTAPAPSPWEYRTGLGYQFGSRFTVPGGGLQSAPAPVNGGVGDVPTGGNLGRIGSGLGTAADVLGIGISPFAAEAAGGEKFGKALGGITAGTIGGVGILAGSAGGIGAGALIGGPVAGAAGLLAGSTAFGSATGQESGGFTGITGPNGQPIVGTGGGFAGPRAPGAPPPSGLDRLAQGLAQGRQRLGADIATGNRPVPVDVTHQGGVAVGPPSPAPKPGQPGFIGPVGVPQPTPQVSAPQVAGPQPAPQQLAPQPQGQLGRAAGQAPLGGPAAGGYMDYKSVYGGDVPGQLPFNAQTPMDAFMSGMSSVGNIASAAFQVFDDIINNIAAAQQIGDTLVRGPENTEDIVKIITNVQTFLKTGADISSLVGQVGGLVGGAGGGDPTGMTSAVGGAISSVAGITTAAIQGVNEAITLGIEVYHEVGKYAGILEGFMLGGPNTGVLGGNVRMMLNTRTNELYTYSEDNALNKNTLNVPRWLRSYTQQSTPVIQQQTNYYAGPGDSPQQFMSDSMYMATIGNASTASVSGKT